MNIDRVKLIERKSNDELAKVYDMLQDYVVKCKCSHTILMNGKADRVICRYCGNYVYKDKKTEFKYRMKGILR